MNPLFETGPIPGLKPDGHIERRGRPKHETCPYCSAPRDWEKRIQDERARVLEEISDFDIKTNTFGNSIENPLMHLGDVKRLLLSSLQSPNNESI
jgi:hypothetical protein